MNDTKNSKVTLILPVRRAGRQVMRCLRSVCAGTMVPEILVMDCTAVPGALDQMERQFPNVRVFDLGMNPGRAHAVNTGIHLARTPYVMTLSPRLIVGKHCVERLCGALESDGSLLSAQAAILAVDEPSQTGRREGAVKRDREKKEDSLRIQSAGWSLALGAEPVVRGNGAKTSSYARRAKILAAQMDAAIYRMEYLEVTGIFDERYYGRLEDLDLGYRGILCGFSNLYEPGAVCRETEDPGESRFYSQLETGNMVYFRYKFGMDSPVTGFAERLREQIGSRLRGNITERLKAFGTDPALREAIERGRMLSFQAEMEKMERDELGMSVTKQTLPEEFCLQVQEDGPIGVYPLYLGERYPGEGEDDPFGDLAGALKIRAAMLAGMAEKIRSGWQ